MIEEKFNVIQFFGDNTYHTYADEVDATTALKAAYQLIHDIGCQTGMIVRVIITDVGDCTNFEWKFGEGIVYPPEIVEMEKAYGHSLGLR